MGTLFGRTRRHVLSSVVVCSLVAVTFAIRACHRVLLLLGIVMLKAQINIFKTVRSIQNVFHDLSKLEFERASEMIMNIKSPQDTILYGLETNMRVFLSWARLSKEQKIFVSPTLSFVLTISQNLILQLL